MATGIFKGPKGALMFMGATLLSVAMLVGTEEDEGALVVAADGLGRDSDPYDAPEFGPPVSRSLPAQPVPEPFDDSPSYDDDSMLIDDAAGFDPTPESQQPFDSGGPSGDVVVVETYEQIQ